MAEIVGADKIINYLRKYTFRKIKISKGTDVVYTDSVKTNGEEEILLERLETWINDFIEPDNYKEYKLELYGTNKETEVKNLSPVIKIAIQFNGKSYTSRPVMGAVNNTGLNYNEYTRLAVENQRLTSELERLGEKLNEIIEEQDSEPQKETITGKIGDALLNRADDIISLLIMKLSGMEYRPQGLNGIETTSTDVEAEDELIQVYDEFKEINPDIINDLKRLLNLAKTNRPFFDMLIKQLRTM